MDVHTRSPSSQPSPPHIPQGPTSKGRAHLDRIRDNQRRSRARRKEYLQELEDKFRQCEQKGVEANMEMQVAARRVLEENNRLRAILRERGVSDEEMNAYIGLGDAAASDEPASAMQAGIKIAAAPSLATGTATPGMPGRTGSSPVQELTGMLNTRRPCCVGGADSDTCCPDMSTTVKQETQDTIPLPSRRIAPGSRNPSTGGSSTTSSIQGRNSSNNAVPTLESGQLGFNASMSTLAPTAHRLSDGALPWTNQTGSSTSTRAQQLRHQHSHSADLHRNNPQVPPELRNLQHPNFSIPDQSFTNAGYPYNFPDIAMDPLEGPDMSALLAPEVQAQFLRGIGQDPSYGQNIDPFRYQSQTGASYPSQWLDEPQQDLSSWQGGGANQDNWRR